MSKRAVTPTISVSGSRAGSGAFPYKRNQIRTKLDSDVNVLTENTNFIWPGMMSSISASSRI